MLSNRKKLIKRMFILLNLFAICLAPYVYNITVQNEKQIMHKINVYEKPEVYVSLFVALISLAGLFVTTAQFLSSIFFQIKKEKRENEHSQLELEIKRLEADKLRRELQSIEDKKKPFFQLTDKDSK